jgi:phytoene synthase
MTNILRDLDEDAAMGRLYLPKEALSAAGIASRDIAEVLSHPRLGEACMVVTERARRHFAGAEAASLRGRRAAMRSPRLMASVYKSVLDRLVERGWTAPRTSVRPTRSQILWRILRHGLF